MKMCNLCGRRFNENDERSNVTLKGSMCYGSRFDGCDIEADICNDCADKLIKACRISPVKLDRFGGFDIEIIELDGGTNRHQAEGISIHLI